MSHWCCGRCRSSDTGRSYTRPHLTKKNNVHFKVTDEWMVKTLITSKDVHRFDFWRRYFFMKCRRRYLFEILQIRQKKQKNQSEGQICPYRHRSACRSSQRRSYTGKTRGCSDRCPRGDRESDHTHPHLTKKNQSPPYYRKFIERFYHIFSKWK